MGLTLLRVVAVGVPAPLGLVLLVVSLVGQKSPEDPTVQSHGSEGHSGGVHEDYGSSDYGSSDRHSGGVHEQRAAVT